MFVRGVKVLMDVDVQVFRGHSLYIFSELISHIFNLKVQMNSFVDVFVRDLNTKQEFIPMRTERWWQEASVIDELFKTPTAFEFIQTTRLFRHAPNTAVLKELV